MPLERIQPSVAFEPEPTTRACWQGTMDGSGSGGAGSSTSSASGMSPTHSGLQGGSGDALEGGRGMAPTSSVYASKYGSSNNSSSHSTAEDGYGHGCSYGYSHASGFGSGSGYGASSSLSMTPSSLPISGSTSPALSQHSSTGSFVDNSKGNIKGSSSSSSSSRSNSYLLRPDADSTRASSSACRSASSPHRPSRGDISGQDRQASFSFGFSELGTGWRSAHAPHQGSMDTIVQNQAPATPLADGEHGGKEQEERYLEQKRVAIPQAALHSHSALPLAVPPNEEGNTKLHAPLTPEGHSRFLLSDFAIGKTSNANARASRPSTAPSDPTAHPSLCSPPSPPMPPLPHRFAARQQEELAESRIGRAMMTGTLSTATTSSDEEGSRRRGRRRSSLFLDNYDDGRGQEDKNECYLGSGPPSPAPEEGWGGSGGGEDGHMHHAHEHGRSAAMRRLDEGGGSQNQSLDLLGRFGFTGRFAVSPALLSPTTPSEEKRGTAVDAQARRETDEQEEKDTDPLAQFDVRRTSGSQARAGADGSSAHQSWTSFSAPQPQARQRSASNAQVSSGIVNGPKQRDSISALREAGSPSASGSGAGALGRAGSWGRAAGIASIGSPRVRQGGIDVLADVDPLASFAAFAGSASLSKAGRASAAADAHDPALPSHVPASVGASSLQKQLQQQQAQDISGTGQKGNERKDKQQQQPQHASRPAVAHRSSGGSVNSHMSLLSQAHSDSSTASATSAGTASTALTRPGSRLSGDSISSIGISALSQSLLHTISPQQQQPKSATTSASAGSSVAAPTVPSSRHPNSGVVLVEDSSVRGERSTEKRSSRSSNAVSDTASGDTLAPALSDSPIKQRGGEEAQEVIEHAANQPALADFASPSTKLSRPSIDTCMLSTPNARSLRDSACSASPHQAGAEAASTPSPDSLSLSPNSDSLHRSPSTNASMTPTASHGLGLSEAVKLLMSPPSARVDDAASTVRQPLFDSTAQSGPLPSHTASADSLTGLSAEQLPLPSPSPSSLPQGLPARTTEGVGEHVQRRHTGVFLSRTRSQMLSQPDLFTAFSGAGGGRAAARAKAMQPVNFDNAPFSVLEARAKVMATSSQSTAMSGAELSSGPSAKWTRATTSVSVPPSPGNFLSSTALASPGWIAALNARPIMSLLGTASTSAPLSNATTSVADVSPASGPSSPLGNVFGAAWSAFADWNGFTSLSSLSEIGDLMTSSMAVQEDEEADGAAADATCREQDEGSVAATPEIDNADALESEAAAFVRPTTPATRKTKRLSALTMSGRPSMGGTQSGLPANKPMLRTPTTQEWSQFLAQQGVNPTLPRSRTATGSSRTGGRLVQSPPSELDLDGAASESDGSDEDDHGLLEQLQRHLSSSRIGSSARSRTDESPLGTSVSLVPGVMSCKELEGQLSRPTPITSVSSSPRKFNIEVADPSLTDVASDRFNKVADPAMRLSPSRAGRLDMSVEQRSLYGYPPPPSGQQRSIQDFVIICDIGRGAYGLVKKAKLKGTDEKPHGKEFIIKYIIKSRILADCWRRHRVLGPIPIEIHVMDQLRRLPYEAPKELDAWAPEKLFPGTPARQQSASNEAATAHPNLAQMLEFFEDHEFYYLVMPCFGKGQDLFDFVEGAPDGLDARHVRCICGQVADGLAYLHAHNIVHRDIKDENVILDGRGHAQIIDFGSAAHIKPGRLFDTFSGTLDYAAAEILQGEKYSGKEQDVWALGVVLYVLMCGECPFWNGEEAVAGLASGSRAALALEERCMMGNWVQQQQQNSDSSANADADLCDTDEWLTRRSPSRNGSDDGQADGGGKLIDAADLIHRCLCIEKEDRPTAAQVCTHRFLAGDKGWRGPRGWEHLQVS